MAPGGVLLYETFAQGNESVGKPSRPDFLLQPGELLRRPCGRVFVHVHDGPDLDPRHLHDVGDQVAAALVNAHHRDHDRVGRGPDCAAGREGAGRGHPDVQELPAADHIRRVHG